MMFDFKGKDDSLFGANPPDVETDPTKERKDTIIRGVDGPEVTGDSATELLASHGTTAIYLIVLNNCTPMPFYTCM